MRFEIFGTINKPSLMIIPGLGVSYQIFQPLLDLLQDDFHIIAVQIDGFMVDGNGHAIPSHFTSVDNQACQIVDYVKQNYGGRLDGAYGLSLGGAILAQVQEKDGITIDHIILDAAPLLPLPHWVNYLLRHYQSLNVRCCYSFNGFYKKLFNSHYFDVLLDELKKVYPSEGSKAVKNAYASVYSTRLNKVVGKDIHFLYGTKEKFVAKPMFKHLLSLHPSTHLVEFPKMQHGQQVVDHPDDIATRLKNIILS